MVAALTVTFAMWRRTRGQSLPVEHPGALHRVANAMHAALYRLLFAVIGRGTANASVRGVSLAGFFALPQLGDPTWHGR